MTLIYITGVAGVGKTTVLNELKRRGYEAYDADENLSSWEHKVTRQRVATSDHTLTTDPIFFEAHDWYIDVQGVSDLAKSASQKIVFLCGSVANDAKVWTFFDKVFCLYVDNKTLEQRLINRLDKDFGKAKHELERVIKLNRDAQNKYKTLGAVIINNTQPTSTVAEEILAKS